MCSTPLRLPMDARARLEPWDVAIKMTREKVCHYRALYWRDRYRHKYERMRCKDTAQSRTRNNDFVLWRDETSKSSQPCRVPACAKHSLTRT